MEREYHPRCPGGDAQDQPEGLIRGSGLPRFQDESVGRVVVRQVTESEERGGRREIPKRRLDNYKLAFHIPIQNKAWGTRISDIR